MGIDIQAVSPAPQQTYYWTEPGEGAELARMVNERLAEIVSKWPDRFVALGTVPLQDSGSRRMRAEHAVKHLGLRGVEINPSVNGMDLTDPRLALEKFFAKAQELDVVIFMHPIGFTQGERLTNHYFNNVIGNPLETTVAASHLIFDGVMERNPRLKIVLPHAGGYLAHYWARMDHAWKARPDCRTVIKKKPSSYLEKFYFDTITFDRTMLENMVEALRRRPRGARHRLSVRHGDGAPGRLHRRDSGDCLFRQEQDHGRQRRPASWNRCRSQESRLESKNQRRSPNELHQKEGARRSGGRRAQRRYSCKARARTAERMKIGMSMPQTGSLGAGGQAALVALRMWVDDVNQKGGLLGRKVELHRLRRPDQPGQRPRHLHQAARRRQGRPADRAVRHRADRAAHADGQAAQPASHGQLLVPGEREGARTTCGSTTRRGTTPRAGRTASSRTGRRSGSKTVAFLAADQEFAQNLANGARELAKKAGIKAVYDQNYPPTTTDFSSLIRGIRAAKPDMVFVMSYPNDSVAIVRAVNEIGVGAGVKMFGGGMVGLQFTPIMPVAGQPAQRHRQLQLLRAGHEVPRHRGVPRALREEGGRGQGRPARLLPAAVQLRHRPDARAGGERHQEPRPEEARRVPAQERDEDHRRPDQATARTASGPTRAWCRRSSAAWSTRTWSSSASRASRS